MDGATRKENTITEQTLPNLSRHADLLLEREPHLDRIIGRRLAAVRDSQHLTLDELSALSGIPQDELTDYEAGEIPVSMSRVRLIAATLDLTPSDLFTRLVCPGS